MTQHIIDGSATARQQLLQMLRDVCIGCATLCDNSAATPELWQERAKNAIKACMTLQRGLIRSHPALADELHMLATHIQIAIAAQSDEALHRARVEKVRDAVVHLHQTGSSI